MTRSALVLALALSLFSAAAAAQECPHAQKPAGCAGEDPSLGKGKCIWSWEGVEWTLLERDGALTAQAVVPGCPKRSAAIRAAIADKVPTCRDGACGCGDCPFAAAGVTFEVRSEAKALFVTATGPADRLAVFKAALEAKTAATKAGGGCGAEKADVFRPDGAGGCGCGK